MYHQMNRVPAKKVSPDFLRALKSTPQLPPQAHNIFKENHMQIPMMYSMPRQLPASKNSTVPLPKEKLPSPAVQSQKPVEKKSNGIIEGDFSKIAQSYVLEGNRLRKLELIDSITDQIRGNREILDSNISPQEPDYNGLMTFKEKVKLQYLEKKGFLKPEQKDRLNKVRSIKNLPIQPVQPQMKSKDPYHRPQDHRERRPTSPDQMHPDFYKQVFGQQYGYDGEGYYQNEGYQQNNSDPYHDMMHGAGRKPTQEEMLYRSAGENRSFANEQFYPQKKQMIQKAPRNQQEYEPEPNIVITREQEYNPEPGYEELYNSEMPRQQGSRHPQEQMARQRGSHSPEGNVESLHPHYKVPGHQSAMKPYANCQQNASMYGNRRRGFY